MPRQQGQCLRARTLRGLLQFEVVDEEVDCIRVGRTVVTTPKQTGDSAWLDVVPVIGVSGVGVDAIGVFVVFFGQQRICSQGDDVGGVITLSYLTCNLIVTRKTKLFH